MMASSAAERRQLQYERGNVIQDLGTFFGETFMDTAASAAAGQNWFEGLARWGERKLQGIDKEPEQTAPNLNPQLNGDPMQQLVATLNNLNTTMIAMNKKLG